MNGRAKKWITFAYNCSRICSLGNTGTVENKEKRIQSMANSFESSNDAIVRILN